MHAAPIDDSMSGTTAISVFFVGDNLHVANVGDSRAIIAQLNTTTGELIAKPLSIDQTPFRKVSSLFICHPSSSFFVFFISHGGAC